jgi:hypothetical protein
MTMQPLEEIGDYKLYEMMQFFWNSDLSGFRRDVTAPSLKVIYKFPVNHQSRISASNVNILH